ncbi:MAG: RnfH family protein [Rhizobacter sp.]|nr:RnfH family protein [Rhizobacter sp.]
MASAELRIELAYSPGPRQVECQSLSLAPGSTVGDAIVQSGLLGRHAELALDSLVVGVWGARKTLGDALRDRDRVEVYRPLRVDPKEARRQRYRSHRARTAG